MIQSNWFDLIVDFLYPVFNGERSQYWFPRVKEHPAPKHIPKSPMKTIATFMIEQFFFSNVSKLHAIFFFFFSGLKIGKANWRRIVKWENWMRRKWSFVFNIKNWIKQKKSKNAIKNNNNQFSSLCLEKYKFVGGEENQCLFSWRSSRYLRKLVWGLDRIEYNFLQGQREDLSIPMLPIPS